MNSQVILYTVGFWPYSVHPDIPKNNNRPVHIQSETSPLLFIQCERGLGL